MVHKKYIKRRGKTFGPYLYENYRENGVTKTRYLGRTSEKKIKKGIRNIKKSVRKNKTLFILVGIVLFFLILTFSGLFFLEKSRFLSMDELEGELSSEIVDVFVNIFPNNPPEILNITDEIYVCENTFLSYIFNVIDADKVVDEFGNLIVNVDISDKDPFYITSSVLDDYTIESEIFSFSALDKTHVEQKRNGNDAWAVYPETITADDWMLSDSVDTDIIVIEVNNPPSFDIGAQTIDLYTKGENTLFYYNLGAFLVAQGEETPLQDLIFNLDFLSAVPPFFGINAEGIINFTGNDSFILPGQNFTTYHLNLSVQDTGLASLRDNVHPNISLCYAYGLTEDSQSWSQDFYLTITKENRAPQIISYYPNLSLSALGTNVLYFNMTAKDPDYTPLDVYWYVDSVEEAHISGFNRTDLSEFEYIFGCNIFGNHVIKVVVTDGLLNDSIQWNLSLTNVACPIVLPEVSGGGGSGGFFCKEKWGCEEWNQCENLLRGIVSNEITKEQELLINERCEIFNYTEDSCGFQTRDCFDANRCRTNKSKPGIIRECYYTEHPDCTDGIKNCHSGVCEVLVDCGGPCVPCKTCSDGIKNQGEEKIDCGGPCKPCIEIPFTSFFFKSVISYSLIALLILILVLIFRQLKKYKVFKEMEIKTPKKTLQTLKNVGDKKHLPKFIFIIFVIILLFLANTFIINFAQTGKFIPGPEDISSLASYGFLNNFIRNLPILFVSGPIINGNTRLIMWDDTDSSDRYSFCDMYCVEKLKSGLWTVYFYANYTDNTIYLPLSTGACNISFQDSSGVYGSPVSMNYNSGSELFEYNRTFDYKGSYDFNITCSEGGILVSGEDDFEITNTEPYIIRTAAGYIDFDADGLKEAWQCFEDTFCYYNFSSNVSEDDTNEVLIYDYNINPNTTLTGFTLNFSTGILGINITHSADTGTGVNAKKIELTVQDSERTVSAILEVDVFDVNDAPVFVNLQDKDLNSRELFQYTILASDEEDDFPFTFLVDFIDCDPATLVARGNCTLFTADDYVVDGLNGFLNLSFTLKDIDVGNYIVNFSVVDNSSLGNKMTSQVVNFTVQFALWNDSSNYNYSLVEDQPHSDFPLDLNTKIVNATPPVIFYNETSFPSFNLTSDGIIDFIPEDVDVGNYYFKIIAEDFLMKPSFKFFNFTIDNINDDPNIVLINAEGVISIDFNYNIDVYENANVQIFLFVEDDDFLIPLGQKSFYDENLDLDLTIVGPNIALFNFVLDSVSGNQARYYASFTPRALDVGDYEVIINITDNSSVSDILSFNLTIFSRSYDTPQILYPDISTEFNFFENISSNLIFRANHTVGDNLTYMFYVDNELKYEIDYYGDARDLNWNFVPNFTEETYGLINNLTLVVLNPFFSDLNTSRTWNLTINHTNAPMEFIRDIGDKKGISLDYSLMVDLKNHFSDVDYFDTYYNQSVRFDIVGTQGVILVSGVSSDWIFALSSSVPITESFNITAYDLNMTNTSFSLTNDTSNNFIVEFVPPTLVPVPTPTPVTSRTRTVPISIKIIMPGKISAYEGEKMDIPLTLINSGSRVFMDLDLNSSAFKDGDLFNEIKTSLDKTFFKSLKPGEEENLTLSVFFDTDKIGDYEILVNVVSKSPSYRDWGKIYVSLQAINESEARELILFTQEFIAQNPQCIEIKEVVNEAQKYFEAGDYARAREKAEQAIDACEEFISQVSRPRLRIKDFKSWYLLLAIILAFVIGLVYYFFKRRGLKSLRKAVPSTALLGQHKKV